MAALQDFQLPSIVDVPDGWVITWEFDELRSDEPVHVVRWEPEAPRTLGGEQVSVVFSRRDKRLISYRHAHLDPETVDAVDRGDATLLSRAESSRIAEETMSAVDESVARRSVPMRIETQRRTWIGPTGTRVDIPVHWHKFAAPTGGFSWVTVGPRGAVIEYERDSQWDFMRSRRASEQWDHDGWIAAREGTGPQLESPAALA